MRIPSTRSRSRRASPKGTRLRRRPASTASPLVLTGKSLNVKDLVSVARDRRRVRIDPEALARCRQSHALVLSIAESGLPTYGVTLGVGSHLKEAVHADSFRAYNHAMIRAHCTAIGPPVRAVETRAVLLARLNTLLQATAGCQLPLIQRHADFLNKDLLPIIPRLGSVGEADVTALAHVGLAMIGEGKVRLNGRMRSARMALEEVSLAPLVLGPRDGLALLGSNAFAAGPAALLIHDVRSLLETADLVFALSLEGLAGSPAPLDAAIRGLRPYMGQGLSAVAATRFLEGSRLWTSKPFDDRIQDPLSFRVAPQVHGAARDVLEHLKSQILIQLNSSEDNPCVLLSEGRIVPSGNFDPLPWVLGLESLCLALCHVSALSCFRMVKLCNPKFTGLPHHLAPPDTCVVGLAEVQKTFTSLHNEIRHHTNPVSADFFSIAADMEDHATNAPFVVRKTSVIVENLWRILAIEALHAAQACDLRKPARFGKGTARALRRFRKNVPFLHADRALSRDIEAATACLRSRDFLHSAMDSNMRNRSSRKDQK